MKGLVLLAAVLLTVPACEKKTDDPVGPDVITPAEGIVLTKSEQQMTVSANELGFKVFRRISTPQEQVFISPLSLSLALAMTSAGADGQTEAQMRKVLGFEKVSNTAMADYFAKMTEALLKVDESTTFEIANSIWFDKSISLKNGFVSDVTDYYKSEVSSIDFTLPSAAKAINGWCSEKTHGKINSVVDDCNGIAMLLANALYFNGKWGGFEFRPAIKGTFTDYTGKSVKMDIMNATEPLAYCQGKNADMVEIPYGNNAFAMDILLPHENSSLEKVIADLDSQTWDEMTGRLRKSDLVVLSLPKFKSEYFIQLNDALKDCGMTDAFTGKANFSKMSTVPMCIDKVLQKTFVDVYEKGTEAAAVTVVEMKVTSVGPTKQIIFDVNRPFIYAIRERSTGAILFLGQKTK